MFYFCTKFQALETLRQISDGSVDDIEFPGNPSDFVQTSIKEEDIDDSKYFSNDYPLQGISYYYTPTNFSLEIRVIIKIESNP